MSAEVRPGYKLTEVGVIPEDWKCCQIQELLSSGIITSHLDGNHGELYPRSNEFKEFGVPYVGANSFKDDAIDFASCKFLTKERASLFRKGISKSGDILFAHNATVGPVAKLITDLDYVILSTTATYFRCNNNFLSNDYLLQYLKSSHFVDQYVPVMSQSTRNQVPITAQRKFYLALPSVTEQQVIANALSEMDSLISSLDQLIAKKRDIKQAAMQQLLTGQKRLPGFSGEWVVRCLGDIAILNRTNIVPGNCSEKLFTHFSLPAFDEGRCPVVEFGESIGSNKFCVPFNAVLVSKLNPRIPRVWLPSDIPANSVASTEFLVLTPKEGVSRKYLFVVCSSPVFCEQMELSATGTTGSHQRINPTSALGISVSIPIDEAEQTAIATLLSDMDAELAALEQRRDKAKLLKQGMMQELLTGRIRLL